MTISLIGRWIFVVCSMVVVNCHVVSEEPLEPELAELRLVLSKLGADSEQGKWGQEQCQAVIRLLTEDLAIARTESELFQKKWAEAQLRAQTLGVDFADADSTRIQRQLIESVRSLYLVEEGRQRLIELMKKLISTAEGEGDLTLELARAKDILATIESPSEQNMTHQPPQLRPGQATLESAEILDFNVDLQLAVLNVGLLEGARVGMPFVVIRGYQVVAELTVVEVRKRICGAVVYKADPGIKLERGDLVRVSASKS